MCVDIQGVDDLYTDPQLHTYPGEADDSSLMSTPQRTGSIDSVGSLDYFTVESPTGPVTSMSSASQQEVHGGEGDLGLMGYALFFRSHVCNPVCKTLGLQEFAVPQSLPKPKLAVTKTAEISEATGNVITTRLSSTVEVREYSPTVPKSFVIEADQLQSDLPPKPTYVTPRKMRFATLVRRISMPSKKPRAPFLRLPTLPHIPAHPIQQGILGQPTPSQPTPSSTQLTSILALTHRTLAQAHSVPGKLPVFSSEDHDLDRDHAAIFHLTKAADLGDATAAWYLSCAFDPERHDSQPEFEFEKADGKRLPWVEEEKRSKEVCLEWARKAAEAGSVTGCLRVADNLPSESAEKLEWLEKAVELLTDRANLPVTPSDLNEFQTRHQRILMKHLLEAESRFPARAGIAEPEIWSIAAAIAAEKANQGKKEEAAEWFERAAEECVELGLGKKAETFYMKAEEARG